MANLSPKVVMNPIFSNSSSRKSYKSLSKHLWPVKVLHNPKPVAVILHINPDPQSLISLFFLVFIAVAVICIKKAVDSGYAFLINISNAKIHRSKNKLDYAKVRDKILVRKSSEMISFRLTEEKEFSEMADCALDAGALGMIVIIDGEKLNPAPFHYWLLVCRIRTIRASITSSYEE